jgi:hypothetical protein
VVEVLVLVLVVVLGVKVVKVVKVVKCFVDDPRHEIHSDSKEQNVAKI